MAYQEEVKACIAVHELHATEEHHRKIERHGGATFGGFGLSGGGGTSETDKLARQVNEHNRRLSSSAAFVCFHHLPRGFPWRDIATYRTTVYCRYDRSRLFLMRLQYIYILRAASHVLNRLPQDSTPRRWLTLHLTA